MADTEKKKTSSFKKFFSLGKKEEKPGDKVKQEEPGESDFDFGYSETTKKALGSAAVTKGKWNPVEDEEIKKKPSAVSDTSAAVGYDQANFETDEGEVIIQGHTAPRFEPVKKTLWSDEQPVHDDAVVTIDEINDLSGLIIPKSATFEVDELKIQDRTKIFDLKSSGGIPAHKDSALRGEGIRTISEAATVIEAEAPKASILTKLNPLSAIHHEVVEYDRKIHGPIVDLTFRPRPGVEEIELYPVNEPYGYIRITYDHATHENTYEILEPVLTSPEEELFREIKERIFERLDINTQNMPDEQARTTLRNVSDEVIADFGIHLTPLQREKILYSMYKEFLGNGMIDPIMHDRYIEDISCDGVNSYLFVYHTRYESMRTNLRYKTAEELDSFVTKLAQRSGKYISIAEPMLDSTMHDGSRIQMTLGTEVTAHGSTYTIRKFKSEPITPTDLIEWSTFSPLSIAFLWLAVESGKSCIFAGGTASGKTTSLNAISLFIPPLAKIVTLEDTRELKLPHPNWIPSVTRTSFDTEGKGEINMYELLRAALRQRPEYLLVGEVRGKEALTLFQAMSTGHITYSTIHADSVASIVHRLENPPLDVPRNMLSALDLVSVQVQARIGGQRIRRNKQLVEILDIDPRTNELITNEVFRWHPVTDEITYSGKSFVLEEIMESRGWTESRMREELKMRQEVLEWMRVKKIREYRDVSNILIQYYRDPTKIMETVRADLYE
ncbi:MAG: type II/IV secretion system ATPase subunit [Methanoregulaceae archaeon]|nr:type II/IV secretion system ATPase subunit [Methanoregulaceae archaeon]